jgi:hypothetical protein
MELSQWEYKQLLGMVIMFFTAYLVYVRGALLMQDVQDVRVIGSAQTKRVALCYCLCFQFVGVLPITG